MSDVQLEHISTWSSPDKEVMRRGLKRLRSELRPLVRDPGATVAAGLLPTVVQLTNLLQGPAGQLRLAAMDADLRQQRDVQEMRARKSAPAMFAADVDLRDT